MRPSVTATCAALHVPSTHACRARTSEVGLVMAAPEVVWCVSVRPRAPPRARPRGSRNPRGGRPSAWRAAGRTLAGRRRPEPEATRDWASTVPAATPSTTGTPISSATTAHSSAMPAQPTPTTSAPSSWSARRRSSTSSLRAATSPRPGQDLARAHRDARVRGTRTSPPARARPPVMRPSVVTTANRRPTGSRRAWRPRRSRSRATAPAHGWRRGPGRRSTRPRRRRPRRPPERDLLRMPGTASASS